MKLEHILFNRIVIWFFIFAFNIACDYRKEKTLFDKNNHIQIVFSLPDTIELIKEGNNKFISSNDIFKESIIQLIVQVNGNCSACVFKLQKWDSLICKWNVTCTREFTPVFIVNTYDLMNFKMMAFNFLSFKHILIYDRTEEIKNKYHMDSLEAVLVRNKKILIYGSPINNRKLEKEYFNLLN